MKGKLPLEHTVIRSKVIELIARVKRVKQSDLELADEQDFIADLAIDSLDAVNLTIDLGRTFGFSFGEHLEDLDALASLGGLVGLVSRRATINV
jgi:acyl carrier protein